MNFVPGIVAENIDKDLFIGNSLAVRVSFFEIKVFKLLTGLEEFGASDDSSVLRSIILFAKASMKFSDNLEV